MFITVQDSGAQGLIPMSGLGDDYFVYDEPTQTLSGRRTRVTYHLAQQVNVRLTEASPITGGMIFSLVGVSTQIASTSDAAAERSPADRLGGRGQQGRRRR